MWAGTHDRPPPYGDTSPQQDQPGTCARKPSAIGLALLVEGRERVGHRLRRPGLVGVEPVIDLGRRHDGDCFSVHDEDLPRDPLRAC